MRSGHDLTVVTSAFCSVIVAIFFYFLLPALRAAPVRKTLAGAEGFEPPSSVLETDSLTVELTPLNTLSDFAIESLSD